MCAKRWSTYGLKGNLWIVKLILGGCLPCGGSLCGRIHLAAYYCYKTWKWRACNNNKNTTLTPSLACGQLSRCYTTMHASKVIWAFWLDWLCQNCCQAPRACTFLSANKRKSARIYEDLPVICRPNGDHLYMASTKSWSNKVVSNQSTNDGKVANLI